MPLPQSFINETDILNVIIETPKGSSNKYTYDFETGLFKLKKSLPAGLVFPFDFGFVPHTLAEDGDPVDVMVLTDAPTFPDCHIECKVLGVIKVKQQKKEKLVRNDRVIAAHTGSKNYASATTLNDLHDGLIEEITSFFEAYIQQSGKALERLGNGDAQEALQLIRGSCKE